MPRAASVALISDGHQSSHVHEVPLTPQLKNDRSSSHDNVIQWYKNKTEANTF